MRFSRVSSASAAMMSPSLPMIEASASALPPAPAQMS